MEILNNIWTALSTPNEGLVSILLIPACFAENFLIMTLFLSIFNIDTSTKQKNIYLLTSSLFSILSINLLPAPTNTIINYFIMILLTYIVFKFSIFKSTISIISAGLILNLIGALILNPFLRIFSITTQELTIVPIYRLLYMLLMYTITIIVIVILKNRKLNIKFIDNIDKKTKYITISSIILGFINIIIQSIIAVYYMNNLPILITFLNFISFLAYFIISIYSITRVFKLTLVTKKLQSAKEYNETLRILHDNVRGFKHDFDNIVTTIGGYVKTNDMEGLKKYYSQLEDDCQRANNLYVLNPDIVNNDGIYNLLTKKYHEAEEKDIKVNITFLLDLSTLHMKIYEFARILGILLDNAIEASSECKDKVINLVFRNDDKNSRQLIVVENTYTDKDVDTEKIFEKGISGKENHTGLGLWEVRKIVKKNHNINLYTSKNDKYFNQQLEIYY